MRLLFVLIFPLLLSAQVIKKIEFEGLLHLSDVSAKDISLIKEGEGIDYEKINESIKRFYEQGYFEKIEAHVTDNRLVYKFLEKPVIREVLFSDGFSDEVKDSVVDKFKLRKGKTFNPEMLDQIKAYITELYETQGFYNSIVTLKRVQEKRKVSLKFSLEKGKKIIIREVEFIGNKTFTKSRLQSEMLNKESTPDLLRWLSIVFDDGEYKLAGLIGAGTTSDQVRIKDFYMKYGFLDAQVSKPLFKANFDNYAAKLTYKIAEGRRFKVTKVDVDFIQKIDLDGNRLKEKFELLGGNYFNVVKLRKDLTTIRTTVADMGYAYVKVIPDIKKESNTTASVTYRVIPNEKVYIKDVVISGNDKTLDKVIRRSIYLTPGELYSYTDKVDSQNALRRSGYFDSVEIEEKRIDDTHMVIYVNVKEGLTGQLRAGITYGSYDKFGYNIAATERNVFGGGHTASIDVNKNSTSETYSITLKNPQINDSIYSLSSSIFRSVYGGYNYTTDKDGFNIGIGRKLGRFWSTSLTYGYEEVKLSDYDEEDLDYLKEQSYKSYVLPSIMYNSTDYYYFPRNGILFNSSLEFAGLGGNHEYMKSNNTLKFFMPLEGDFDTLAIFKYKVLAGVIKDYGYLPINEKFYLGGLGSVRGYERGSISPEDDNNTSIGGKYKVVNSFEVSVPVSLKDKMWVSAFVDYGLLGEDELDIVRSSYGISLDWITPVGPLNFTYAWAINSDENDSLSRFEFNIGAGF